MIELNSKEREVVLLTFEGTKQKDIAEKLKIDLSTVYRILKRKHVQEAINQATRVVFSETVKKVISSYDQCLERVQGEIKTMPINYVISVMNHCKSLVSNFQIEASRDLYKKITQSEHSPQVVEIQYSDTKYNKDKEIKNYLKKYGVPEEKYKNEFFG